MIIETKGEKVVCQMIVTSPKELRKIADELENQYLQTCKDLGLNSTKKGEKAIVGIINKTKFVEREDGKEYFCIDTWEFE